MKKLLVILAFVGCCYSLEAQTKRGLFIGINTYFPEGAAMGDRGAPPNLDGCVNDALSVKEIMQTRFGFEDKNMITLFNQDASRDRIIKELENLVATSKKGDVVFVYYAGHGSQVNNSLSKEHDKKDETIVPADSYKGVFDIRDKELAVLFNKLLDKGVILTAIFDSCHSGSISRDVNPPKSRFTAGDNRDIMDASEPTPPEERGALLISAARDLEPAKEIKDEQGNPHGGFTVSLLQVLREEQGTSSSQQIFDRVAAIMEYYNLSQKPVIAANETRRSTNLLGLDKSQVSNKLIIPLIKVEGKEVVMQAGFASGVNVNTEMQRKTEKGTVKIKVTRMESINKCRATIIEGDPKILKPGDGFEITNLVMTASAAVKVYVYMSDYTTASLTQTVQEITKGYPVATTTVANPYQSLSFRDNKWYVTYRDKNPAELGNTISTAALKDKIQKDSAFVFNLPATKQLGDAFAARFKEYTNVEIVNNPNDAEYHLVGRWKNGVIEYAFVNPERMYKNNEENKLPAYTNYFALSNNAESENMLVDSLQEYILRIAKVKSWLTLQAPPDDGSFPFGFALRHSSTGKLVGDGEEVQYNDTFGLVFTLDEANEAYWDRNKRYIYVFSVDNYGAMKLLYPQTITGENVYPAVDKRTFEIVQNAPVGAKRLFKIGTTPGIDNYIMLTSTEQLHNLDVFKQEGVLRAVEGTRGGNGLDQLLEGVGTATRSELIAPANWSIHRISVKCVPRK